MVVSGYQPEGKRGKIILLQLEVIFKLSSLLIVLSVDIKCIAGTPGCTPEDLEEFTELLHRMVHYCGYNIDGDGETEIPLVIR